MDLLLQGIPLGLAPFEGMMEDGLGRRRHPAHLTQPT